MKLVTITATLDMVKLFINDLKVKWTVDLSIFLKFS